MFLFFCLESWLFLASAGASILKQNSAMLNFDWLSGGGEERGGGCPPDVIVVPTIIIVAE